MNKTVEEGILVVSADDSFRANLRILLEKEGYRVLTRESLKMVVRLLELQEVTMVITDNQLADADGLEFIENIRDSKAYYDQIPIYLIVDEANPDLCVQAFDKGASEYTEKPLNRKVFLARVNKIVSERKRLRENPVTLAVKVNAPEVPGIFQLIETEGKTGQLRATCHQSIAEIIFHNGKIVRAESAKCAGEDALTEVLSWPFVQMRFTTKDISNEKRDCDIQVSTALMDCVLEVDKYREVETRLHDTEMSFEKGEKPLPKESNAIAKKAHRLASSGCTIEEIVNSLGISRRHALTLIDQLVRGHYLNITRMPFEKYVGDGQKFFLSNKTFFSNKLPMIIKDLQALEFPLLRDLDMFKLENPKDANRRTLKLVLTGDDNEMVQQFFDKLQCLSSNASGVKNSIKVLRKDAHVTRLDFPSAVSIELMSLPSKADDIFVKEWLETLEELMAVVFISSSHEIEVARSNRRRLKQMRNFFCGDYYIITPIKSNEISEFRLNCDYCGNSLTMDMDEAGAEGLCPICNTEVVIPDPISHAQEILKLPEEVLCPVVSLENSEQTRDLLVFILENLLEKVTAVSAH